MTKKDRKGMAERNNPLGQRIPSEHVGPDESTLEHGQSAELVDGIREKARQVQGAGTPPKKKSEAYDPEGPERQPGKVVRQTNIGQTPRKKRGGQYTQDNEEEGPKV